MLSIANVLSWLRATYGPEAILTGWGAIALGYFVLHLFELVAPAERGQRYASMLANTKITAAYLGLTPVVNFLPGLFASSVVRWCGGSVINLDVHAMPGYASPAKFVVLVLFALLSVLAFDFFYYWFHRLQHSNRWLWEQHRFHHSDQSLNVTTSLRHHWLEEPLRSMIIVLPMNLLIRLSPVEAGVVSVLIGQWGYIIHMNARVRLGWMTPILAGPHAHRVHHSIEPRHLNRNFAAFSPIWDVLFGTFYWPGRDEFPKTGIVMVDSNHRFGDILFGPFIAWYRMLPHFHPRPTASYPESSEKRASY